MGPLGSGGFVCGLRRFSFEFEDWIGNVLDGGERLWGFIWILKFCGRCATVDARVG